MLRLLRVELPQREDALGRRALLGAVRLQAQHQSAAAQLLETQREHKGLHEGNILNGGGRVRVKEDGLKLMELLKCCFVFFICDVIMLRYLMALLDGAFELHRFREGDDPFESNLLRLCSIRTDADV